VDDKAFQAKYLPMARLLWEASEGLPEDIPSGYARHLAHTFIDGDISLGSLLPVVENPLLFYVLSGSIPPNPAELLMRNRLSVLMEELRDQFDYIINLN
jgi:Mrp family chromosome partitioning ATPase